MSTLGQLETELETMRKQANILWSQWYDRQIESIAGHNIAVVNAGAENAYDRIMQFKADDQVVTKETATLCYHLGISISDFIYAIHDDEFYLPKYRIALGEDEYTLDTICDPYGNRYVTSGKDIGCFLITGEEVFNGDLIGDHCCGRATVMSSVKMDVYVVKRI
jgi:hypothetical protein